MAENRLRELRDEVSGESTLLRERVTLAQAGEHFIAHVRFLGRSPNTISSYEGYLRAQLVALLRGRGAFAGREDHPGRCQALHAETRG